MKFLKNTQTSRGNQYSESLKAKTRWKLKISLLCFGILCDVGKVVRKTLEH